MQAPMGRFEKWGAIVVLFALIPLAAFVAGQFKAGGFLDARRHEITVRASDAASLNAGDRVMMKGLQIGEVESLELSARHDIEIRCVIYKPYVPFMTSESIVYVVPPPVVGSGHIEIRPGGGEPRTEFDGQEKPSIETRAFALLDDVQSLIGKTESEVVNLGTTLRAFDTSLAALNKILELVGEGRGSLGKIVVDEELYQKLDGIVEGLSGLPGIVEGLKGLPEMIEGLREPLLTEQLPRIATNLVEVTGKLDGVLSTVAVGLEEFPETMTRANVALKEGRRVLESVKRNALIRGNLPRDPDPERMIPASRRSGAASDR